MVPIRLVVQKPGDEEAARILAELATRLDKPFIKPDVNGVAHIRFGGPGTTGREAWAAVTDALDQVTPEWQQWIHIGPQPSR